jgi:(S)-ureidoglycine aminohydrolase
MRTQSQLLHSRTRVKRRYALLPLEGVPFPRLPEWPGAAVRVLAGPALGAGFAEYLLDVPAGQGGAHPADGTIEFFLSVLSGSLAVTIDGRTSPLAAGGYALIPPNKGFTAAATE